MSTVGSSQIGTAAVALLLVVLTGCGTPTSGTTEALLPIAVSSSVVPATETPTGSQPSTGIPEVQQATLDQLVSAYEAGDSDAVLSLWGPAGDHYRFEIESDLAMGGRWSNVACEASQYAGPRCELLYTNDLLEAFGAPPLEGYVRVEMADDGTIDHWIYDRGNLATTAAIILPFSEWVGTTDPDAAEEMFDWNGFARQTPESLELWNQKVAEYLETHN